MTDVRARLSWNIGFWMEKLGMNVKDLIEKSGMKKTAIYRIKAGDLGATTDSIAKLADAFGIDPQLMLAPVPVDNGESDV